VTAALPLDQIKRVKSAYGVTVNDVVLAMVTGALRDHLAAAGATPDRPLVAGVPVSTRTEGTPLRANSVSTLFVSLPAHLADPVEQVEAVHATTKGAKEQSNLLGVDLLSDWSELTPPRPYSAVIRWYSARNLADRTPPPINLVVSNVPGPRETLYIAGAELVAIYSMGPILEGIGLNVTVWSYRDELFAGVVSCPELLPDLRALVERFAPALDRLEAAAPAA
jgi:WS/DGAT/MGAT family acyltransferase